MPQLRFSLALMALLLAGFALAACEGGSERPTAPSASASPTAGTAIEQPATPAPETAVTGPQSQRLLLIEGAAIFVQETDGTRRLIARVEEAEGFATYPAWSPDGESIAFVRRLGYSGEAEADWGDDLLVVPAAGGEPHLLRQHSAKGELIVGLAWRPDSEQLLVGRLQIGFSNGIPSRTDAATIVEIDTMRGGERTVLDGGYDPSLSADGGRMAYLRFEEASIATVMVANADGSDAVVLAGADSFNVVRVPRISPDGQTVAFAGATPVEASMTPPQRGWGAALLGALGPVAPRRAEAHGAPMDIWLADATTTEVTRLTFAGEDDPYLGWSPDGERVIFIAASGLYEVSISGEPLVRTGEGRFAGKLAVAPD